jgi:hypothetical protein
MAAGFMATSGHCNTLPSLHLHVSSWLQLGTCLPGKFLCLLGLEQRTADKEQTPVLVWVCVRLLPGTSKQQLGYASIIPKSSGIVGILNMGK